MEIEICSLFQPVEILKTKIPKIFIYPHKSLTNLWSTDLQKFSPIATNQEVLNFLEPIISGGVNLTIYFWNDWSPEMFDLLACFAGKIQSLRAFNRKMSFAEFFFVKQLLLNNATFIDVFEEIDEEVILEIF